MDREARYGAHSYEVRVATGVSDSGVLYVDADSVTVGPSGALMFAAEMDPLEALEDDGETLRPNAGIEVPPVVIVAPGQWYTVKMVDSDLKSMFTYANRSDYEDQHQEQ
jgi:hypothetical protein